VSAEASFSCEKDTADESEDGVRNFMETGLALDGVLSDVSGRPSIGTTEGHIDAGRVLRERDEAVEGEPVSQLLDSDEIRKDEESLVGRAEASEERTDAPRGEQMSVRGDMNSVKPEVDEIDQKCKSVGSLNERLDKVKQERDALIEKAKGETEITEEVKAEIENIRSQYKKDFGLLEEELNTLRAENEVITKERNAYILKAQLLARNGDGMRNEMDALRSEVEISRSHVKDVAKLEEQLKCVRTQHDDMKGQRDPGMLQTKLTAVYRDALYKERDRLESEGENSRRLCEEYAMMVDHLNALRVENDTIRKKRREACVRKAERLTRDRDEIKKAKDELKRVSEISRRQSKNAALLDEQLYILRKQHDEIRKYRDALKRERDARKREVENSRGQYRDIALLEKQLDLLRAKNNTTRNERNYFVLKLQRLAGSRDAIWKEKGALKREGEIFRRQCEDVAVLEDRLSIAREECDVIKRESNDFIY
jgi:chromosome segregation ATPase